MDRQSSRQTWAVAAASASALALEVGLLRLFSLAHFYHFATFSVSVALLGFGAGGTLLVLRPGWAEGLGRRWRPALLTQTAVVLASYLVLNHLPLDTFQLAWSRRQWLYLLLYYLALLLPFLWAGLVVSGAFVRAPEESHRLYFANLLGSAAGAGAALGAQALPGGWGAVATSTALPLVALLVDRGYRWPAVAGLVLLLVGVGASPDALEPRLSPHKRLSQILLQPEARLVETRWSPALRVDVVSAPTIRSAPGLSLAFGGQVPAGLGLTVDGDNLATVVRSGGAYLDSLPEAVAYELARPERVLLLYPRGGLQVALALDRAAEVVALEAEPAVGGVALAHSAVLREARLSLHAGGIRPALAAEPGRFDLVLLPLPDSFQTVAAGSYSLQESYVYTVEGFRALWERVAPGGFLVVTRWVQVPPSEELRAWALVLEATGASKESLAAYRSFQTLTILARRGPLGAGELSALRRLTVERSYDLVYLPDLGEEEANRFNRLPEPVHARAFRALLEAEDRGAYYAGYPFAVEPPTDDRPFFFHFFTRQQWPELRARLGKTYEAFAGGGILLLLGLLLLSLAAAGVLILAPAAVLGPALPLRGGPLVYFAGLGVGFLFLEVALIQKLILLLGQAVYATALVLVGLLGASGLGSLASRRVPSGWPARAMVPLGLALLVLLRASPDWVLGWPLAGRVAWGLALTAPLGFVMGMPFPQGLARVRRLDARWVPWGWAINGATSVVSALAASLVSLSYGLSWLVALGAAAYGMAAVAHGRLGPAAGEERTGPAGDQRRSGRGRGQVSPRGSARPPGPGGRSARRPRTR